MTYEVEATDLKNSLNKKLVDFAKKYPKTKTFRLELGENWVPENFYIKKYKKVENRNIRLIQIPIEIDSIPTFELKPEDLEKLNTLNINFKLPKEKDRLLSKILPTEVIMDRLTPMEFDDLINEMLQKQAQLKNKEKNQEQMQQEIDENLLSIETDKEENEKKNQSLNDRFLRVLDKEEELNLLTAKVESIRLDQEKEAEMNAAITDKLRMDVSELQEKYDDADFERTNCQEQLTQVNERLGSAEQAEKELNRIQKLIDLKNNELKQLNALDQSNDDDNSAKKNLSSYASKITKMLTPSRKSNEETDQLPKPFIPLIKPRSSIRPRQLELVPDRPKRTHFNEENDNVQRDAITKQNSTGYEFGNSNGIDISRMNVELPTLDTSNHTAIELFIDTFDSITKFFQPQDIKKLIINILIKNNLSELIPFLTEEDLSSVERFSDFLRQTYSTDEVVLRKKYEDLRQNDMDCLKYFRLCFRSYYTSKGLRPPKNFNLVTSKSERADISFKFVSTLKDSRLREKLFLEDVEFQDLPKKATKYSQIFMRTDPSNQIFEIKAEVNYCTLCGSRSHEKEDCMASPKNRRQHRKRMERSYSREKQNENYYTRGRENSRGRDYSKNRRNSPRYSYSRSRTRYPSQDRNVHYRDRGRSKSYDRYRYKSRSPSYGRRRRSNSYNRNTDYRGYRGRSSSRDRRYSSNRRSNSRDYSKERYQRRNSSPRVRFNE